MVKMVCQEQQVTEEEYREFERLFPHSLPDAFRTYFMNNNGGFCSEEDQEDDKFGFPIGGFESIKYGRMPIEKQVEDYGDLTFEEFGTWEKFEFVPFAHDRGGHSIFLSLRGSDDGCVYIFSYGDGNIAKIAPSFEAFLSNAFKGDFT